MQKGETEKADEFFTEAEKLVRLLLLHRAFSSLYFNLLQLSSLPDENQQKDFNLGCVYSLWFALPPLSLSLSLVPSLASRPQAKVRAVPYRPRALSGTRVSAARLHGRGTRFQ